MPNHNDFHAATRTYEAVNDERDEEFHVKPDVVVVIRFLGAEVMHH